MAEAKYLPMDGHGMGSLELWSNLFWVFLKQPLLATHTKSCSVGPAGLLFLILRENRMQGGFQAFAEVKFSKFRSITFTQIYSEHVSLNVGANRIIKQFPRAFEKHIFI